MAFHVALALSSSPILNATIGPASPSQQYAASGETKVPKSPREVKQAAPGMRGGVRRSENGAGSEVVGPGGPGCGNIDGDLESWAVAGQSGHG